MGLTYGIISHSVVPALFFFFFSSSNSGHPRIFFLYWDGPRVKEEEKKKRVEKRKEMTEQIIDSPTNEISSDQNNEDVKNRYVTLQIADANGGAIFFKVKRTMKMKKLMEKYCEHKGLLKGSVRFTFDGNRIGGDSTPTDLEMDDQDVIDTMVEQTGGWLYTWGTS